MSRIVYGVSGEGSGHSSRARAMTGHLESLGHEVRIASYDRGYANLCDDFSCFEIQGLHIATRNNRVSVPRTFFENGRKLPKFVRAFRALRRELFREFRPHAVISDFEPMTAYVSRLEKLPLITLDNQHRIRYMQYPRDGRSRFAELNTRVAIRAMIPTPDVSLVTTFYFGEVSNDRTFLFPPILREIVLSQSPTRGGHILVYHTRPYESFIECAQSFPNEKFVVYGYERDGIEGPLEFKPFSVEGFMHDLVTAKAVMATAGFTLMTEALHLGKPMLATPMAGQFEQELNGLLLEQLGYGKNVRELRPAAMADFLYRLPEYEQRLRSYARDGNASIAAKLGELAADDCAAAVGMREGRSGSRS